MWKRCVASAALIGLLLAAPLASAGAADSAVILLYHRIGDDRIAGLNTEPGQMEAHLAELRQGGYAVRPLAEIVAAMGTDQPLPEKTVAITVDDASLTVFDRAWPRLKKAGMDFTLFIATDEVDRGGPDIMSWSQIRELAAVGIGIGSQGAARLHMSKATPDQISADLARARQRFEAELGRAPTLFAWPGGEGSAEATEILRQAGFTAAFGQHSGALWTKADPFFLPRFALNKAFGETDRFRMAVRSLPLKLVDITPADPMLKTNPPAFGFTLAEEIAGIDGLACFASHQGQVKVERLGPRVEVRMSKPFPAGRGRLNCTLPGLEGRWRWFGWQFTTP
ncbi:Xylanase/chitin deacetylase [Candidatus Terasakiella magnetica]|nr:Xylanase/chitin deacetylase [Candidatus Terasakiella magnetica]